MPRRQVLDGVQVIEVASMVSGPYATKLLAEFGADVLKVEPVDGDPSRRHGPFRDDTPDLNASGLFLYLNTNKRAISLDLTTYTGRKILLDLVATADVLVVDLSIDELERLKLDLSEIAAANGRLIVGAITPFGLEGPYARYKGHNLNLYQTGGDGWLLPSGLSHELFPDRQPLKPGGHVGDYYAGLNAAVGLIAALHARGDSGEGQIVDLNKLDAHVSLSREHIMWYANQGLLETRDTRGFAFGGCVPCEDGFVEIVCLSDGQFDALVELMGRPAWAEDEKFQDLSQRAEHGAEVNAHLREWARVLPRDEIYERGRQLGVPIGIFSRPGDVVNSEHERIRDYFINAEHPTAGAITYPRQGFVSDMPAETDSPAPVLGQDNFDVLKNLGYTREEILKLWQLKVL
ncbi:MAG: CoA transferase [Dehalococcoidia bacterium]|nr:CoA transferase [Dehalococcoidia bacterium]